MVRFMYLNEGDSSCGGNMLVKLFTIFYSTFAVLASETVYPNNHNVFPQEPFVQELEPNIYDRERVFEVPFMNSASSTICPANELLLQIESIITNFLKNLDVNYKRYKNIDDILEIDKVLSDTQGNKNHAFPSSKTKSLLELLGENDLSGNLKTKISVQYELPNYEDLSCKQALTEVLDISRNLKPLQDLSRSRCSYEDCNGRGLLKKDNIGKNNNVYNNVLKILHEYPRNDIINSNLDWIKLIKYIAPTQNDLVNNGETRGQGFPYISRATGIPDEVNNLPLVDSEPKHPQDLKKNPVNNSPNQLVVTEELLSTIITPDNKKLNLTGIFGDISKKQDTQVPIAVNINQAADVDGSQYDFIKATSNANAVPINQFEGQLSSVSYKNKINRDGPYNVDTSGPNTSFLDISSKVPNRNNPVSSMIISDGKRMQFLSDLPQSNFWFKQLPQQVTDNIRYLSPVPQYIDPMNGNSQGSNYNTLSNEYFTYNRESSDNTLTNQGNTWPMYAYPTPGVGGNPSLLNSKLVEYGHNQLHASNNLGNLPWIDGVTNQLKLNTAPGNSGVMELTYVLRQPNPMVYQPIYFVKYRIPFDTFLNNVRSLLQTQPRLRYDPAKLYEKILTTTKVAEVSPSLKGVDQKKLLQMIANNGALVKTKVVQVNDTVLNKHLEIIRNLNSNLTPKDLMHFAYPKKFKAEKTSDVHKNDLQDDLRNQVRIQNKNIDKNDEDSSIFNHNKEESANDLIIEESTIRIFESNDSEEISTLE